MRIRNNGPAKRSYSSYRVNTGALNKNLEKLSSGYKINRSGDDAAGLAISEKMRAQITGLGGAQNNAKDGISLIQTTEGALQEYHDIVNRMLELSVQSANATYEDGVDREQLQKEMSRLAQELNRIADSTNFNGTYPLRGEIYTSVDDGIELASVTLSNGVTGSPGSGNDYSHYHSTGMTDDDKKTGTNASWTFGGFTWSFDATKPEYSTLDGQLLGFRDAYNTSDEPNASKASGWKAHLYHGSGVYAYANEDGTFGSNKTKSYICFDSYGSNPDRQSPEGLYPTPYYPYTQGSPLSRGALAETKINFNGKTGDEMMGAVMLLGENSEYGNYQFVADTSDAENGYSPIVIDNEANSAEIAQAVALYTQDIPNFQKSSESSTVIFREREYNGDNAIPVSFEKILTAEMKDAGNPSIRLLIGETGDEVNFMDVPCFNMHASAIGLRGVDISTQDGASNAIDKIKTAINNISDVRGTYGALQNRLEHTINYLGNAQENMQSAESVIRDTDMAAEMMKYTKNSILTQSAQSMLAQANMLPEGALRLLQ